MAGERQRRERRASSGEKTPRRVEAEEEAPRAKAKTETKASAADEAKKARPVEDDDEDVESEAADPDEAEDEDEDEDEDEHEPDEDEAEDEDEDEEEARAAGARDEDDDDDDAPVQKRRRSKEADFERPPAPRKFGVVTLAIAGVIACAAAYTLYGQLKQRHAEKEPVELGPVVLPAHVTARDYPSTSPQQWSDDGFFELVPTLKLPTRVDNSSRITVWLRLPEGKSIDVKEIPEQKRVSLVFPVGSVADRLELVGDPLAIVDVRGTELLENGAESFHVFRRAGAGLHGFIWPRGEQETNDAVTRLLVAQARRTERSDKGLDSLRVNNECAPCHAHARETLIRPSRGLPNRGTDTNGWFVPETVLSDRTPFERHRPRDLNMEYPFVKYRCTGVDNKESDADVVTHQDGMKAPECKDGSNPFGTVDMVAAVAAEDEYALRVCESRKALHERMTEAARKAFAPAFKECGI